MATPLLYFCAMSAPRRWLRLSLLGAVGLNVLGVLGTYSRGGLLALAAMGAVLWLYSRNKLVIGALVLSLGLLGLFFMPGEWLDRMNSIGGYEQANRRGAPARLGLRQSAGRRAPLIGGGFKVFALNTQDKGANGEDALNAHSILRGPGRARLPGPVPVPGLPPSQPCGPPARPPGVRGNGTTSPGQHSSAAAFRPSSPATRSAARSSPSASSTLYYHLAAIALLTRLAVRQAPATAGEPEARPFTPPPPWPITVPAFVGRTWPAPGGQNGS